MLNSDSHEKGNQINRSNQQKANLHVQHTFFVQTFAVLHDTLLFCTTKTYNFLVTHYFYGGIAVFAHQKFCCLCCYSIFFHSRSFSPRWLQAFLMFITAAIKFLCFSSNEICLLCFKSLALAIHWYAYDVEGGVTRIYGHVITKISQMDG